MELTFEKETCAIITHGGQAGPSLPGRALVLKLEQACGEGPGRLAEALGKAARPRPPHPRKCSSLTPTGSWVVQSPAQVLHPQISTFHGQCARQRPVDMATARDGPHLAWFQCGQ